MRAALPSLPVDRVALVALIALIALLPLASFAQDPDDAPPPVAPASDAPAAAPVAPRPSGPAPRSLAQDPDGPQALEAYNAGRYNDAARRFLTLVQRWPREPAPYLALARSRVYAGDAPGAVEAYQIHLKLSPQSADRAKIESELALAQRKAGGQRGGTPPKVRELLQTAQVRAKSGLFEGSEGAYGALDMALEAELIGPEIADTRDVIREALLNASIDAIDRWWQPAALLSDETLTTLLSSWQVAEGRRGLSPIEEKHRGGLAALAALRKGAHVKAAKILAPIAPGNPRLRYAQALALLKAGRTAEAESILSALVEEDPAPRLLALLGLVRSALGRPDGVDALRAAVLDE